MKLQHLAIIFIIIILPISLVMGEYIQAQIDTIMMQTSYSKKLQDATYDALKAFQINTINNKYSSISDSKIRDIEASITTFYNSLGTSMGASGYDVDTLKEYIPAMVYTLYDGYYIYGKYFNYNQTGSSGNFQNGLKPYIYYACRYVNGSMDDFVVNYTLDNSITIYGKVNGKYVTKSGYVIDPSLVSVTNSISFDESAFNKLDNYSSNYSQLDHNLYSGIKYPTQVIYDNDTKKINIGLEVLKEQIVTLNDDGEPEYLEPKKYEYTCFNNQKIYKDDTPDELGRTQYFIYKNNKKQYLSDDGKLITTEQYFDDSETEQEKKNKTRGEVTPLMYAIIMTSDDGHLQSNSAAEYYAKAYEFSKWIKNNISDINQNHAVNPDGSGVLELTVNTGAERIFDFNSTNNPLLEGSTFNEHRMAVIRNSIETNLSAAIANYNVGSGVVNEFQMPKFTEEDWQKLLNNVSLSVFMQGIPMKSKVFNSYCIVTNDKNEEVVTEDAIYIVTRNKTTDTIEMHEPGCSDLVNNISNYEILGAFNSIDFEIQTISIGEEDTYYYYPQNALRCYNCIVNVSDSYDVNDIIQGKIKDYDPLTDTYTDRDVNKDLRKMYLTALGRTRYDLYRTNQDL